MLAFSAEGCSSEHDEEAWILDSGASMHMTFKRDYFCELKESQYNNSVKLVNKQSIKVCGEGTILIDKQVNDTMGVPVHEIKKKKESLMTTFRTNMKKKFDSLKSGAGEEDAFKPIWQFYDAMYVFLKDVYECKSICNSEEHVSKTNNSFL
ncbi:unnamed protein product [Arctia plantaginis]|uniref:Retrovirus-related Pol polyprotein from transposon TNT 1-94-like beta-barrel domain-containing protein n=1 Tax=Arctia plantaginis TaxID=874455 RepID=A0A8S0YRS2_ARCPL|nr:unnamed protein product [Arctia plantaginis]